MKSLSRTILGIYLLTLLWLILFKFSLDVSSAFGYQTGLNLVPFADASRGDSGEMMSNFAVFIPLGLLLSICFKQTVFRRKLAFIFVFSLAAELSQFAFAIGAADITDVITNTSGGLAGLLFYSLNSRYINTKKLDRFIVTAIAVLLVSVLGILFSGTVRFQSVSTAEVLPSQTPVAQDVQLDWPADGQAAVGSVEKGLLARSSDNEKQRPTASMAKVITALAILEKQPLMLGEAGSSYTLTSGDVAIYRSYVAKDGSVLPVYEGMELTQYEAMQMMLIASANNIADTLVERVFGSEEAYISYAQDMLHRLKLDRTVVADASGFNPDTVSTPSELVAIGILALRNPVIAEIVAQPHAQIPGVGVITNTNQLLGADGVVGIKTGTTDEAGSCLLFAASYTDKDGQSGTLVGVVMGAQDADSLFRDSGELLASAKQGFGQAEAQTAGNTVAPPPKQRGRAPVR